MLRLTKHRTLNLWCGAPRKLQSYVNQNADSSKLAEQPCRESLQILTYRFRVEWISTANRVFRSSRRWAPSTKAASIATGSYSAYI